MSQTKATLLGDAFSTGASGTIPVGGIILWSGTIANIANLSGWELCDGSNGTPDLRDKFVVGAHSDGASNVSFNTAGTPSGHYAPGNTGGSVAHTLTVAQMPSHTHFVYNQISGPGSYGEGGGSGTTTGTTSAAGSSHAHENRPPYYALAYIMRVS
tara:strand:+ start:270 stop:737 length:468 start_codon:yes stop_codon:yes gene_type:complete